jgi:hypothetical protein
MLIATKLFQVAPPRPSQLSLSATFTKRPGPRAKVAHFGKLLIRSGHMLQLLPPTWRGRPRQLVAFGCARQIFHRFLHFRILVSDGRAATARSRRG